MALSEELCGILATGIDKERAAHDFYLQAAGKTKNPLGKKMFQRLADEETRHEQLLASWSKQGACPAAVPGGALDADFVRKGRGKVAEAIQSDTADLQAIEFGRQMERQAIAFYEAGAAKAEDQASKDLFLKLKAEEDKHLALLTDLYEYMKDPNLWSVREGGAHFDS
ncbi:MAG: ferritin family protein [Planctomycetes bacterium]|nr:ferritin family protein [Planctomycetota bacterium]